jgi:hypothetical protein
MAMAGFAYADGVGQNDTTYSIDYISSFHARIVSYSPNLWRIDADTSEIRQAFDDAMLIVSKLEGATERKDTVVMDSSLWYNLPTDFQLIARVSYKDPSGVGEIGLEGILLDDIGKNTMVGTDHPRYYAVWNRQVYFDRNNYLLDTMYVYYNAYSANLASDSVISNVSKRYFNIVVDQAILLFYSGRVGTVVPQILALADKRLAEEYARLGIEYKSITPDVR